MNGNHYRGKKRHGWVQSASENYLALFWLLGGSDFLSKGSKLEFIWQQDLIVNRDNLNKLSNSDILKKKNLSFKEHDTRLHNTEQWKGGLIRLKSMTTCLRSQSGGGFTRLSFLV